MGRGGLTESDAFQFCSPTSAMQLLSSLVLVSVALCASQVQALSSLGTTVTLGNVSYFVPPTPAARLSLSRSSESVSLQKSGQALVPFTFVSSSSKSFSTSDLAEVSKKNGASDDVWSSEFLAGEFQVSCGLIHLLTIG